ncbi:hypothetical protein AVEN_233600-1 [Araneus ventricosus]|uniref:Uncharacterized protein n=1 Tax=Araneus ventricosus TaxID=182803 RepID=A0A4Y2M540_ARAVE|nr:hypothetical protein AVEN_233600-1 [Araneus ventricosus]
MTRLTSDVSHKRGSPVYCTCYSRIRRTFILFQFLSNMVLMMCSYQTWCLGTIFTLRILEISFPASKRSQKHGKGVTKRTLTSVWKKLWPESTVEFDIEESETVPCGAYSQRDCAFDQDQGTGGG